MPLLDVATETNNFPGDQPGLPVFFHPNTRPRVLFSLGKSWCLGHDSLQQTVFPEINRG